MQWERRKIIKWYPKFAEIIEEDWRRRTECPEKIQDKIEQYENCIWKWRETDKEFGGDDKVGEQ